MYGKLRCLYRNIIAIFYPEKILSGFSMHSKSLCDFVCVQLRNNAHIQRNCPYGKVSEIGFKNVTAYRIDLLSGLVSSLMHIAVLWFVWTNVFAASGQSSIKGFTLPLMITYVAVSAIIKSFLFTNIEFDIEHDVKQGYIATSLTKPYNYPVYLLFVQIGKRFFHFLMITIPMILVSILFLKISITQNLLFFIVSFALAFFVQFLIGFLTGMWAFFSEGSIWGVRFSRQMIEQVVSGSLIPLYLFPVWFEKIAIMLPFASVYHIPLSIYIGKFSGMEIIYGIGQQILWIALLGLFSAFVWNTCKKRIFVYGG